MNLVENVKGSKEIFCKYIGDKGRLGKYRPTAEEDRGPGDMRPGKA